ncbi:MAG: hypothetical protein JWO82_3423 [Akkermansiaceae bacterium]|nr:hypothetical protein [Akkermansiaceae bacterium]
MKAILLLLACLLVVVPPARADTSVRLKFEKIETLDGQTYNHAILQKWYPDRALFLHDLGSVTLPFDKLPPAIRQQVETRPAQVAVEAETAAKEGLGKPPSPLADPYAPPYPVKFDKLTTLDGKEYRDISITKVGALSLSFMHAEGNATILFERLPESVRREFLFDPVKAKALQEEAARVAEEKRQEAARLKQAEEERRKQLAEDREREEAAAEAQAEEEAKNPPVAEGSGVAQKPAALDLQVIRKEPLPGVFYPLPIPYQKMSFSKATGRRFVIPIQLTNLDNVQIRITGASDNTGDYGMRWELRTASKKKTLDASFLDYPGTRAFTVRHVPERQLELLLTDDDTSFKGKSAGNGFGVQVLETK